MKTLKFKCSNCGGKVLEEVMVDVVMSSIIKKICKGPDGGDLEYDSNIETHDGEVDRYQCENCGKVITDEAGNTIKKLDELLEWLESLEINKKGVEK